MVPKTASLPGMENRGIAELDDLCREYDKVKKKRMDLTKREVELQADMLVVLKKNKLKHYAFDGIEADLVIEKEKVRVKIVAEEDEE